MPLSIYTCMHKYVWTYIGWLPEIYSMAPTPWALQDIWTVAPVAFQPELIDGGVPGP